VVGGAEVVGPDVAVVLVADGPPHDVKMKIPEISKENTRHRTFLFIPSSFVAVPWQAMAVCAGNIPCLEICVKYDICRICTVYLSVPDTIWM